MKWFKKCVTTDYANFNGRARREEYWMFVLFNMIIAAVLGFVLGLLSLPDWLAYIYSLAIVVLDRFYSIDWRNLVANIVLQG